MTRAYVGLGSNLGDRERNIRRALDLLGSKADIRVVAVSGLRETEPVGVRDQPRFLNGACALETELGPRQLLDRLLSVERGVGRERDHARFAPRVIDLDLLLYGDRAIDEPGLRVPHPRLAGRRFALEPLHELAPELVLPDGRRVEELLAAAVE